MLNASRHSNILTLVEAVESAPSLAALQQRIRMSQACLQHIQPLIPVSLKPHLSAGPVEAQEWCLLVTHAAASTKLRQLVPAMLKIFARSGLPITSIRIKLQTAKRS